MHIIEIFLKSLLENLLSIASLILVLIGLIIANKQLNKANESIHFVAYNTILNLELELIKQSNFISELLSKLDALHGNNKKDRLVLENEIKSSFENYANIAEMITSSIGKKVVKEEEIKLKFWKFAFKPLLMKKFFKLDEFTTEDLDGMFPTLYSYCKKWEKEDGTIEN